MKITGSIKPNPVEDTRAWYNRISRLYDSLAWKYEKIATEAGLRVLNVQRGQRVLEIGFGTGHAIISMAGSTGGAGTIYGVDISENMCRITKNAVVRAHLESRVSLVQADARSLPFGNQVFDAIFMSFTLELFSDTDIPLLLSECRRVIRKGGALCIVSLEKTEEPGFAESLYGKLHTIFPRSIDCRPIVLAEVLSDNGFTITKKEKFALWGLPVEIALCKVLNFHESIGPALS